MAVSRISKDPLVSNLPAHSRDLRDPAIRTSTTQGPITTTVAMLSFYPASRCIPSAGVELLQQTGSIIRTGFWSSQTLLHHLSAIVDPPNPNRIKESCYRLSLGHEVYVTENFSSVRRRPSSVQKLAHNQCFVIEPGHFALMITSEAIRMPLDALGFLSIQTDVKFKGLVNISGFHVDPGLNEGAPRMLPG